MNRPRNRHPRQQQNPQGRVNGHRQRPQRAAYPSSVPDIRQVVPGAPVSIVLKQDQPTGHEVQGIVQDVLTSGNHPRGIKVRMTDGRVGRVQRMSNPGSVNPQPALVNARGIARRGNAHQTEPGLPPARTLADFLPESSNVEASGDILPAARSITVRCPICSEFEGDEIAVTRHVEDHLS